eukprot:scpid54447/ scgid27827/ Histone-lysine N-methyltransferase SETD1B-A; SET domain-containing protein 1B-A
MPVGSSAPAGTLINAGATGFVGGMTMLSIDGHSVVVQTPVPAAAGGAPVLTANPSATTTAAVLSAFPGSSGGALAPGGGQFVLAMAPGSAGPAAVVPATAATTASAVKTYGEVSSSTSTSNSAGGGGAHTHSRSAGGSRTGSPRSGATEHHSRHHRHRDHREHRDHQRDHHHHRESPPPPSSSSRHTGRGRQHHHDDAHSHHRRRGDPPPPSSSGSSANQRSHDRQHDRSSRDREHNSRSPPPSSQHHRSSRGATESRPSSSTSRLRSPTASTSSSSRSANGSSGSAGQSRQQQQHRRRNSSPERSPPVSRRSHDSHRSTPPPSSSSHHRHRSPLSRGSERGGSACSKPHRSRSGSGDKPLGTDSAKASTTAPGTPAAPNQGLVEPVSPPSPVADPVESLSQLQRINSLLAEARQGAVPGVTAVREILSGGGATGVSSASPADEAAADVPAANAVSPLMVSTSGGDIDQSGSVPTTGTGPAPSAAAGSLPLASSSLPSVATCTAASLAAPVANGGGACSPSPPSSASTCGRRLSRDLDLNSPALSQSSGYGSGETPSAVEKTPAATLPPPPPPPTTAVPLPTLIDNISPVSSPEQPPLPDDMPPLPPNSAPASPLPPPPPPPADTSADMEMSSDEDSPPGKARKEAPQITMPGSGGGTPLIPPPPLHHLSVPPPPFMQSGVRHPPPPMPGGFMPIGFGPPPPPGTSHMMPPPPINNNSNSGNNTSSSNRASRNSGGSGGGGLQNTPRSPAVPKPDASSAASFSGSSSLTAKLVRRLPVASELAPILGNMVITAGALLKYNDCVAQEQKVLLDQRRSSSSSSNSSSAAAMSSCSSLAAVQEERVREILRQGELLQAEQQSILDAVRDSLRKANKSPTLPDERELACQRSDLVAKKVQALLSTELKEVLKKDIRRKLVEGTAFRMLTDWQAKKKTEAAEAMLNKAGKLSQAPAVATTLSSSDTPSSSAATTTTAAAAAAATSSLAATVAAPTSNSLAGTVSLRVRGCRVSVNAQGRVNHSTIAPLPKFQKKAGAANVSIGKALQAPYSRHHYSPIKRQSASLSGPSWREQTWSQRHHSAPEELQPQPGSRRSLSSMMSAARFEPATEPISSAEEEEEDESDGSSASEDEDSDNSGQEGSSSSLEPSSNEEDLEDDDDEDLDDDDDFAGESSSSDSDVSFEPERKKLKRNDTKSLSTGVDRSGSLRRSPVIQSSSSEDEADLNLEHELLSLGSPKRHPVANMDDLLTPDRDNAQQARQPGVVVQLGSLSGNTGSAAAADAAAAAPMTPTIATTTTAITTAGTKSRNNGRVHFSSTISITSADLASSSPLRASSASLLQDAKPPAQQQQQANVNTIPAAADISTPPCSDKDDKTDDVTSEDVFSDVTSPAKKSPRSRRSSLLPDDFESLSDTDLIKLGLVEPSRSLRRSSSSTRYDDDGRRVDVAPPQDTHNPAAETEGTTEGDALRQEQVCSQQEDSSMQADVAMSPVPAAAGTELPEVKQHVYPPRGKADEQGLVEDFLLFGLDSEDLHYLLEAYTILQEDDALLPYCSLPIATHPPTLDREAMGSTTAAGTPRKRGRPSLHDSSVSDHKTGCARSEGFYKVARAKIPTRTSSHARRLVEAEKPPETTTQRSSSHMPVSSSRSSGREHRAEARRYQAAIGFMDFGAASSFSHNQLHIRHKRLKFSRSPIHDWGLYAMEYINADEMVIEYVGERIRALIADRRERHYEKSGIGSSYLFRVDGDCIIDATKNGNMARFVNHSCQPNCYAKIITVGDEKRIVIYSKHEIQVGQEITYDYKFPLEDDKIP